MATIYKQETVAKYMDMFKEIFEKLTKAQPTDTISSIIS